jgi:LmbE family N-acetylglucosaminyl deacetylase
MDMPVEVPLPLMAVAFPIVPGKTAEWHTFIDELNGPRHQEFANARRRAGVRERTFLQATPMGDLVIVTLDGDDPARSFGQLMAAKDEFTTWFLERVKAVHGVDLTAPMTEAPSKLVVDSEPAG